MADTLNYPKPSTLHKSQEGAQKVLVTKTLPEAPPGFRVLGLIGLRRLQGFIQGSRVIIIRIIGFIGL